ncbi:hypothetical protein DFA_11215 [Cavenderia fasciculata]|uniref:Uncharacterized protein n=1 Tax=Cavenderia fasciculata TaxID=261658 RepID=F4QFK1_CACFS|nr:uncharacterized protein DFA_11215 [Cavenderia fasciculata]EGG13454.1 hypothetical protein DFA_11215 [Cavenderia fasciculata]|eukprot:XP_004350158.1 hypothetical protein DFA_11215 [Cavenderia fasciculata]
MTTRISEFVVKHIYVGQATSGLESVQRDNIKEQENDDDHDHAYTVVNKLEIDQPRIDDDDDDDVCDTIQNNNNVERDLDQPRIDDGSDDHYDTIQNNNNVETDKSRIKDGSEDDHNDTIQNNNNNNNKLDQPRIEDGSDDDDHNEKQNTNDATTKTTQVEEKKKIKRKKNKKTPFVEPGIEVAGVNDECNYPYRYGNVIDVKGVDISKDWTEEILGQYLKEAGFVRGSEKSPSIKAEITPICIQFATLLMNEISRLLDQDLEFTLNRTGNGKMDLDRAFTGMATPLFGVMQRHLPPSYTYMATLFVVSAYVMGLPGYGRGPLANIVKVMLVEMNKEIPRNHPYLLAKIKYTNNRYYSLVYQQRFVEWDKPKLTQYLLNNGIRKFSTTKYPATQDNFNYQQLKVKWDREKITKYLQHNGVRQLRTDKYPPTKENFNCIIALCKAIIGAFIMKNNTNLYTSEQVMEMLQRDQETVESALDKMGRMALPYWELDEEWAFNFHTTNKEKVEAAFDTILGTAQKLYENGDKSAAISMIQNLQSEEFMEQIPTTSTKQQKKKKKSDISNDLKIINNIIYLDHDGVEDYSNIVSLKFQSNFQIKSLGQSSNYTKCTQCIERVVAITPELLNILSTGTYPSCITLCSQFSGETCFLICANTGIGKFGYEFPKDADPLHFCQQASLCPLNEGTPVARTEAIASSPSNPQIGDTLLIKATVFFENALGLGVYQLNITDVDNNLILSNTTLLYDQAASSLAEFELSIDTSDYTFQDGESYQLTSQICGLNCYSVGLYKGSFNLGITTSTINFSSNDNYAHVVIHN